MNTALKRLICRVLIGMLLSTQLAVAAYACPGHGLQSSTGPASTSMSMTAAVDMPSDGMASATLREPAGGHGQMDPHLPNLCSEHCRSDQQKPDPSPAPSLAPVLLRVVYALPAQDTQGAHLTARTGAPTVPGDPPHSILHCCRRD